MDRRLLSAGLAAAAAVAVGVGGFTYAAPDDFVDVRSNAVGAGVLVLDLRAAGRADAVLSFSGLQPGDASSRLLWVAANDAASTVNATLDLSFHRLVDAAAPCATSRGKALGEIASGVGGCTVDGDVVSGVPDRGNLSRVVEVDVRYGPPVTDPASCTRGAATSRAVLPTTGRGNLYRAASAGTAIPLHDGEAPLVLRPGHGVCVAVTVRWPLRVVAADPDNPSDNAAQGDSLRAGVRFELNQVQP